MHGTETQVMAGKGPQLRALTGAWVPLLAVTPPEQTGPRSSLPDCSELLESLGGCAGQLRGFFSRQVLTGDRRETDWQLFACAASSTLVPAPVLPALLLEEDAAAPLSPS